MDKLPLLDHPVDQQSVFTPAHLMESARRARQLPEGPIPALCFFEFDGDLTDWLLAEDLARTFPSWPCFHTTMFAIEIEGVECGIIPRTIGGPYAVLVAEQLAASGSRLIVGLTSAGRISRQLPLPCLVVVTSAIRDEGTSLHYLPAAKEVSCPAPAIAALIFRELVAIGRPVCQGKVWTTDAPYRETQMQLEQWATENVLAVEMQAASLFAFGIAKDVAVVSVALVSNAVDHNGEQFDTGSQQEGLRTIAACVRAFKSAQAEMGLANPLARTGEWPNI